MRIAALLVTGAAFALLAGAASAQLVDPRTAAGAAGQIGDHPAPDIDTPAKIDPSRDPVLAQPSGAPLPGLPQAGKAADLEAGLPPAVDSERTTSAPVFRPAPKPETERKPASKLTKEGLRR